MCFLFIRQENNNIRTKRLKEYDFISPKTVISKKSEVVTVTHKKKTIGNLKMLNFFLEIPHVFIN